MKKLLATKAEHRSQLPRSSCFRTLYRRAAVCDAGASGVQSDTANSGGTVNNGKVKVKTEGMHPESPNRLRPLYGF